MGRVSELELEVAELREQVSALSRALARERGGQDDRTNPVRASVAEREALLSEAERIAHIGSWVWNVGTNSVAWSDQLFRILGYDPATDHASVEAYFDRVHPEDRERARTASERGVSSGIVERVGYRLLLPDGEVRHVKVDGAMLFDADGALHRIVGIVLDVTAAHHAGEIEHRHASLLRGADGVSGLGFVQLNLTTGERWWSQGTRDILGVSADVPPSEHEFLARVHPDDVASLREALARSLAGAPPPVVDYRVVREDGDERYVRGCSGAFATEGDHRFLTIILFDITDQHTLRERLASAHKLEAIGRLAGGVAHDINNLMMVVAAIAMDLEDTRPDAAARLSETIASASALTQGLLSVSGEATLTLETTDLNALVDRVVAAAKPLVPHRVTLRAELEPGLPVVDIDPRRIEQALLNLVLNARDALSHTDGTITVRTSATAERIALEVVDDGPGMQDEVRSRALEPFFTTKPQGQGTGLGLALVRGTAELHGGNLRLDSGPGRGTRVALELPRTLPQQAVVDAPGTAAGTTRRCLLIDDNESVRIAIGALLTRLGYEVVEVGTPDEALRAAGESGDRFDLLISDLVMPEKPGPVVVAELRARGVCPNEVIFVTGYGASAAEMLGPDEVILSKPFTLGQLREALAEASRRARPRTPLSSGH